MSSLGHGLAPKMKPLGLKRSALVAALDIGTSKIACLRKSGAPVCGNPQLANKIQISCGCEIGSNSRRDPCSDQCSVWNRTRTRDRLRWSRHRCCTAVPRPGHSALDDFH